MNIAEQYINKAMMHCETQGVRLTSKRKLILSGLTKSRKALSAYELIDFCKNEFDQVIYPMTMYRALDFLQKEQLVHRMSSNNKYIACTHQKYNQGQNVMQFLICESCDKVEELQLNKNTIEELHNNVGIAGFHLTSPQLEMSCVCEDCYSASQEFN